MLNLTSALGQKRTSTASLQMSAQGHKRSCASLCRFAGEQFAEVGHVHVWRGGAVADYGGLASAGRLELTHNWFCTRFLEPGSTLGGKTTGRCL